MFRPGGVYNPIQIFINLEDESTWTHEIGHSLGFTDEDEDTYAQNASGVYRSAQRASYSIMLASIEDDVDAPGPTCSDVEGLVNLLDAWSVRLAAKAHPQDWPKYVSKRIMRGWKGLEFGTGDFYLLGSSAHVLFERRATLPAVQRRLLEQAFLNRNREMGELSPAERSFVRQLQARERQ